MISIEGVSGDQALVTCLGCHQQTPIRPPPPGTSPILGVWNEGNMKNVDLHNDIWLEGI